jgi:hypothetical protein
MIACFLQSKSAQGPATVETRFREFMLNLSECLKSTFQVVIGLYDDGDRALNVHRVMIPLSRSIVTLLVDIWPQFTPTAEAEAPLLTLWWNGRGICKPRVLFLEIGEHCS